MRIPLNSKYLTISAFVLAALSLNSAQLLA